MKFIHCADMHLDSPFAHSGAFGAVNRRSELRSDFSAMVLYAKTERCSLFIISGDLFDDALVTKDTAEMLVKEMSSFPECKFVISPGNHDPYYEKSPYALINFPENVYIFKENRITYFDFPEINTRVYGYAFTSSYMKESPLAGFTAENSGRINILAAHADVFSHLSPYAPVTESDIRQSGMDYVALGHIHKASELKYAGKVPFAYPGCVEGRDFGEAGHKGAYLCDITKDSLAVKHIRFSKKRYEILKYDANGAASFFDIAADLAMKVAEYGEDTALRVVFEGITKEGFSVNTRNVRELAKRPFYVDVKDNTLPLYNAEYLRSNNTIVGEFYRNIEPLLTAESLETREVAAQALKYGLCALYGREIL